MKSILFATLFVASLSAYAQKSRLPSNTSQAKKTNMSFTARPTMALISTNFIGLSKGELNGQVELLNHPKVAPNFSFASSSFEEKRKKLNNEKAVVQRTYIGVGATYYLNGTQAEKNIIVSPALVFGQEKDVKYVENLSGLALRLGAQLRIQKTIALDGGVMGTNLTGEFKGEPYVRIGALF